VDEDTTCELTSIPTQLSVHANWDLMLLCCGPVLAERVARSLLIHVAHRRSRQTMTDSINLQLLYIARAGLRLLKTANEHRRLQLHSI